MPTYQIETEHGPITVDHDGDPKDLIPAVTGWVHKKTLEVGARQYFDEVAPGLREATSPAALTQLSSGTDQTGGLQKIAGQEVASPTEAARTVGEAFFQSPFEGALPRPTKYRSDVQGPISSAISGITERMESEIERQASGGNLALMGGMGLLEGAGKRLAQLGFATQMASQIPGHLEAINKATDTREKANAWSGLILSGVLTYAAGKKGILGEKSPVTAEARSTQTQAELQNLAPATASVIPKQPASPEFLDGLHIARKTLLKDFTEKPPEVQAARQEQIDDIDSQLTSHDRGAVNESAERTKQPAPPTTPQASPAEGESAGDPPAQGGRSSLFTQALAEQAPLTGEALESRFQELLEKNASEPTSAENRAPEKQAAQAPLTAEVVKEAEPPAPENAQGPVQVKSPQGDWLNAEVVSRDGGTVQLRVDDPIRGLRTEFVQEKELRSAPKEVAPIPKVEAPSEPAHADHISELTQDLKDARDSGDEETAASLERVIGALRKREAGEPVHVADVFGEKQGDYTEALKNEASDDPEVADKAQTAREKLEEDLPQSLKDILYGREPERPKRAPMKKKNAGESGAVTLPASVVQAARAAGESGRKFIEEDVKPFVVEGARNTVEAMRQIKSLVAPANVDEFAKSTAGIIRQNTAELARSYEVARKSLEKASKEFDKLSPADNLKIIDDIETGKVQPTQSLQDFSDTMRKAMDERVAQVRALGTGKLEQVIQNYFPHIWEDPKKATSVYAQIFGKRPLEGSKSFLKQRTIPTTADGIAQGLKPVSNNPVELTLMKLHEMDRYIMGQKIMAEMKEKGLAEFVRATSKPPDGYVKIDDRVAQVVQMRPVVKADGSLGAPEMVLRGHYYAPEGAARVLNNYLSPGLRGIKAYDAFRWLGNTLNQAQLGLSAFHLGFVSMDSGVSKVALGLEHILSGSLLQGLKDIAQSPIAPIMNMVRGNKMLEEYYKPGTQGAEIAGLMDAAMKGGARATMDSFYKTDAWKNMTKAFRSGNVIGGVLRAPFAALDLTMKPVLDYAVPRMKMGMFADMARSEMERIGPNASLEEKRAVMAKAWDSVDNRMGQLVYDNLFWNKSFKDSLMAAQRSVGWNLGTLRELGGGALDTAATPTRALRAARGESPLGEKVVTHRMAYAMALPIVAGVLGAIYQKLHTGMLPGQNKDGTFGGDESALRDMFTPRTGQTTNQGEEERAQLPSYMKDVFAYSKHPVTTIANKASPAISAIAQMLNNKDFYGTQIINPADPLFQKAKDELTFVGKQFVPFSLQGASKRVGKDLETKAESFVGVTPASAELTRTPAHQAMMDSIMKRMPSGARTKEDQARYEVQKAIVEAGKNGTPLSQAIAEAKDKGVNFSARQKANLKKSIRQDPRVIMFSHLTLDEAKKVYALGNKEEKVLFRPLINVKLRKVGEPSIKPR